MKTRLCDAIEALIPNEIFIISLIDGKEVVEYKNPDKAPSEKAIQEKLKELKAEYDAKKYQRDRETAYPEIKEQLDLLYHDMTAGKGDKTGEWYKVVNKVKTDNPK